MILICFHDFARGGTERIAMILAREWIDAGREVTILCGTSEGGTFDQLDTRVRVVELDPPLCRSPLSRLKLGERMAPYVKQLSPEVVFIPGNFHFILGHAFKRAAPHIPIVAKVSNPLLPQLPGAITVLARRLLARYVRPIDRLVCMSPELAGQEQQALPASQFAVIAEPNLPQGFVAPPRTPAGGDPLIIVIGRMEPQKNLPLALQAFAELRRRRPARLLVLGEGAGRKQLETLAGKLGIASHVSMPGYVNNAQEKLAGASAMLLTSRYEGYPAVVVEALAADVPVVSTDCTPALHGLITSGVHGSIVAQANPAALADGLEAAIDQPFASGRVRPSAVSSHDAAASAAAYLELFDRLSGDR